MGSTTNLMEEWMKLYLILFFEGGGLQEFDVLNKVKT